MAKKKISALVAVVKEKETNFGKYLGELADTDFKGRSDLAQHAGVSPAAMTHYIKSGDLPTAATLGLIVQAIKDRKKRMALLTAYVQDIQELIKVEGRIWGEAPAA